jgi:hypothetical protein
MGSGSLVEMMFRDPQQSAMRSVSCRILAVRVTPWVRRLAGAAGGTDALSREPPVTPGFCDHVEKGGDDGRVELGS